MLRPEIPGSPLTRRTTDHDAWIALMLIEVGHFALTLALGLSLVQFAMCVPGHAPMIRGHERRRPTAPVVACAAVVRGPRYVVTSDFSVLNVVENSHSAKPFIYKLSGLGEP